MPESQTQITLSPDFVPTPDHLEKLRAIQALPLHGVRQKIVEQGSLPEAILDEALVEYRKFLFLAALGFRHELAMCSRAVDEVWHTHILFTIDYVRSCNQIFGKYLHHQPQLGNDWGDKERVAGFRETYKGIFGEVPEIWRLGADCNTIRCGPLCETITCVPGGH